MNNQNYLPDVKARYEHLPYPPCDPRDEHKRLQRTWTEDLPMVNHYCFGGRETDGKRSFATIFDLVRADPAVRAEAPDNATLFADFKPVYELLNAIERILLRHSSVPA